MTPQISGYKALKAPTDQAICATKDEISVVVGANIRADMCIAPQVRNAVGMIKVAVTTAHQANTLLASTPLSPLVNGTHIATSKLTTASNVGK